MEKTHRYYLIVILFVQFHLILLPFCPVQDRQLPCCSVNNILLVLSLRTLFKFVKKFEEALSGLCVPALVEQGTNASLDSVDANTGETPIHRVHRALKSILPGKSRDLQVHKEQGFIVVIFFISNMKYFASIFLSSLINTLWL